ncbi:hypothetical protein M2317_001253 [Microbacterium sp. ZKA21]|uniref:hypothetical protein n=1 Tax=Microbacterium sp. ZKA21 TaxID=3381694 RepID=UPI003D1A623D
MSVGIRIDGARARVAASEPEESRTEPFAVALVEARGALLSWTIPPGRFPDAEVHAPLLAAEWLADVYGDAVAEAVRQAATAGTSAEDIALPDETRLAADVRRLALLTWARDWWPAGTAVPPLDTSVLAAEIAIATHRVDHVLDDDEATEHAVSDAVGAPSALAALTSSFAEDAAALADELSSLADDHGVELLPVVERRAEWALAAGGSASGAAGIEIAHGTAPVRWADVPTQTVAADAEARWSLRHAAGEPTLVVEVAAVPGGSADLRARFGPDEPGIDLPLPLSGSVFSGSARVPASVALLPIEQRILWVRDARMAAHPGPVESADAREAALAHASARIVDASAGLAERAAGARR